MLVHVYCIARYIGWERFIILDCQILFCMHFLNSVFVEQYVMILCDNIGL